MVQAEGLESELRSAEAVLADRAAHLKDTQVGAGGAGAAFLCRAGSPLRAR